MEVPVSTPALMQSSLLAAALSLGLGAVPAQATDLLIQDVTVLSPERTAPLTHRDVLIRDGRIASVAASPMPVPAGVSRLDGRGRFLTPGLMDSHVHVSSMGGLPEDGSEPGLVADYVRQQPRSYLYFGVTQVLDLAGFDESIARFRAQPQKPDLFRCGAVTAWKGYPMVFMPEALHGAMNFVVEPGQEKRLPAGIDPAAHTPEAAVAKVAQSGALCVKVFIEDGFGEAHGWPILSADSLKRVREAAHKAGLLLVAHANAYDMQLRAVDARVDVIAHGMWNWNGVAADAPLPSAIAALLQRIHQQGIGFQPTQRVIGGMGDLFAEATLGDPLFAKVSTPGQRAFYASSKGQFFKNTLRADFPAKARDADIAGVYARINAQSGRVLSALHALGQPLLLASDTPSAPVYANQPGLNTYQEMLALAKAGLPLDAIFRAGTLNNARQFRLDRDYGTVEAGKIANLLLLDANPLQDITAWNQIERVIVHGEAIDRASLAAQAGPQT